MALFAFLKRLRTVAYLMSHPAVSLLLKALPIAAIAYVIFPRDLLFDFRIFGYLDDVVVVGLLLGFFTSKGAEQVAKAQKAKDEALPADFVVLNDDKPPEDKPPEPDDASDEAEEPVREPPRADIRS